MPVHNPDCTHGGSHAYSACRDRQNQPLKMLETQEEALVAFGGLVADLGDHDPKSDPDADADAAQRPE
jgi:hypothetical protein